MEATDPTGDQDPLEKPNSSWLLWLVIVVLSLPILWGIGRLALMALFLPSLKTPYDGREKIEFTRAAWIADGEERDGTRYLMLDDLLAKQHLVGRTREEIETLLGPKSHPGSDWDYYLGPEPSCFGVDNIWLSIEFDASDRVVATSTFTD